MSAMCAGFPAFGPPNVRNATKSVIAPMPNMIDPMIMTMVNAC